MVHNCIVTGCRYRKRKNIVKGIVFHSFPIDQTRLINWHSAIIAHCPKPINITRHSKICQFHFLESDYIQTNTNKDEQNERSDNGYRRNTRHLKTTAIPSVFQIWPDESISDVSFQKKISEQNTTEVAQPSQIAYPCNLAYIPPTCPVLSSVKSENFMDTKLSGYLEPSKLNTSVIPTIGPLHNLSALYPPTPFMPFSIDGSPQSYKNEAVDMIQFHDDANSQNRKRKSLIDSIKSLYRKNGEIIDNEEMTGYVNSVNGTSIYNSLSSRKRNFRQSELDSIYLTDIIKRIKRDEEQATALTHAIINLENLGVSQSEIRAQHDFQLYYLLSKANLIHYYSAFLAAGGDDIVQLCQLSHQDFKELIKLVGMQQKPFHVKRLRHVLHRVRMKLKIKRSCDSDNSEIDDNENIVTDVTDNSRPSSSASAPVPGYSTVSQNENFRKQKDIRILSGYMKHAIRQSVEKLCATIDDEVDESGMFTGYQSIKEKCLNKATDCDSILRKLTVFFVNPGKLQSLSNHKHFVNEAAVELCKLKPSLLTKRKELGDLSIRVASEILFNVLSKNSSSTNDDQSEDTNVPSIRLMNNGDSNCLNGEILKNEEVDIKTDVSSVAHMEDAFSQIECSVGLSSDESIISDIQTNKFNDTIHVNSLPNKCNENSTETS